MTFEIETKEGNIEISPDWEEEVKWIAELAYSSYFAGKTFSPDMKKQIMQALREMVSDMCDQEREQWIENNIEEYKAYFKDKAD